MNRTRLVLIVVIAAAIGLFFALDLGRYLSLEFFKSQQAAIDAYVEAQPVRAGLVFFAVYVAVTGLSLPGAAIMTLIAGAVFGLLAGTIIVSFAASIGATLAFLASRFLLRDAIQRRFGASLKSVNEGIARDGAFYLFTLRLVPAFPFFVINLVMGLTPIRTRTFYWVSQVGMLAGTIVYVNAGTQIARIDSLSGILSPGLILSFTLLGLFPLIAKWFVGRIRARRVYARWPRPKAYDRNLVVIGAGSAGLVSAYIAATVKSKVTLIEKHRMGGDCLNTGCVPSKALIRSAKLVASVRNASDLGLKSASVEFEFGDIMERVQRVVRKVEPHDSVARYTALGVECIEGEARITSPWTVEVQTPHGVRVLTTRSIIIAAGARPAVPPIPGIEEVGYLTSDTVWSLRELPPRLIVLGGGPIGSELTQCFARLGSRVTQVEMMPRILGREDPEISELVLRRFLEEGIDVRVNHTARRFTIENGEKVLYCGSEGGEVRIAFDQVLCAVGRVANTAGYGLEELGIPLTRSGTIEVNPWMQTIYPNIYACGDVSGPYQFTHTAAHTAWYAAVNALFGSLRKFRADFSVIPWATFTDPEVARVGLNEIEAREKNVPYEVTTFGLEELDRAIADGTDHGVVKVLTVPGKDRILGVTIAGEHAGDLIVEFILAMRHNLGLNKLLRTIHIYPTLAEANKYAAGNWKRAHAPQNVLSWLERYHGWMRGRPADSAAGARRQPSLGA
jgi:pyruvate/2-oxoglutarate dehydrogenase complex dihydrolipoamide dehydrogenase (E3) component/uncharacterized membrane protein YdjX (TVP38/TMEM64 family)